MAETTTDVHLAQTGPETFPEKQGSRTRNGSTVASRSRGHVFPFEVEQGVQVHPYVY